MAGYKTDLDSLERPRARSPNELLGRLSADEYRRLLPLLENVRVPLPAVIGHRYDTSDRVFFPGSGAYSIVRLMADGQMVEVAGMGRDGLIGHNAYFGATGHSRDTLVEIVAGTAEAMAVAAFRTEMDRRGELYAIVSHYMAGFVATLLQSVACNALHPIEKRCARCLLGMQYRLGVDVLPLTQDRLATLLGVRRASVTVCLASLHRTGLVDSGHKRIVIRNRSALETVACECYRELKDSARRLFADPVPVPRNRPL